MCLRSMAGSFTLIFPYPLSSDWSGPGRTLKRQPMAFEMLYGQLSVLCNWKHIRRACC